MLLEGGARLVPQVHDDKTTRLSFLQKIVPRLHHSIMPVKDGALRAIYELGPHRLLL